MYVWGVVTFPRCPTRMEWLWELQGFFFYRGEVGVEWMATVVAKYQKATRKKLDNNGVGGHMWMLDWSWGDVRVLQVWPQRPWNLHESYRGVHQVFYWLISGVNFLSSGENFDREVIRIFLPWVVPRFCRPINSPLILIFWERLKLGNFYKHYATRSYSWRDDQNHKVNVAVRWLNLWRINSWLNILIFISSETSCYYFNGISIKFSYILMCIIERSPWKQGALEVDSYIYGFRFSYSNQGF